MSKSVFGAAFDRVVVINLDRRSDRMSRVRTQLAGLNLPYERFSAFDGQAPEVASDWHDYLRKPQPERREQQAVKDWRDFYLGDKPHTARVAFFESQNDARGIATSGAWGLFLSMREVVENAVKDDVGALLILEDDAMFHRDTALLWRKVQSELPADWKIFQLGAMQLHWEDDWISWHSQHLYKCQGSSIAAHALALRREAMEALLDRSQQPDLPFDVGPLQEVKRIFRDDCYTAYPNIVIQDPRDSEIGMSKIFATEAQKDDNIYRWDWGAYGPEVLPQAATTSTADPRVEDNLVPRYLQPYSAAPDSAERIIVVFTSADENAAEAYIALLKAQKESEEIAPIVVIDDLGHIPALRSAGLAFEYVPPVESYKEVLPDSRDPELVQLRRLFILRRKWLPRRIIALGDGAQALLALWRASPFEQSDLAADLADDADLFGEKV